MAGRLGEAGLKVVLVEAGVTHPVRLLRIHDKRIGTTGPSQALRERTEEGFVIMSHDHAVPWQMNQEIRRIFKMHNMDPATDERIIQIAPTAGTAIDLPYVIRCIHGQHG